MKNRSLGTNGLIGGQFAVNTRTVDPAGKWSPTPHQFLFLKNGDHNYLAQSTLIEPAAVRQVKNSRWSPLLLLSSWTLLISSIRRVLKLVPSPSGPSASVVTRVSKNLSYDLTYGGGGLESV